MNQPGSHTLLRVPLDPTRDPQLSLQASIASSRENQCGLYIVAVRLEGALLGEQTVHVRPLRRNKAGSNAAGTGTLWPFSLQVSRSGEDPREGGWLSFDTLRADTMAGEGALEAANADLPDHFRILAYRQEQFGDLRESETFQFTIGSGQKQAAVTVMQASHQALNVELAGMGELGEARLGGLLGTERHDRALEIPTEQCRMARGQLEHYQELLGLRPAGEQARFGLESTIGTASW